MQIINLASDPNGFKGDKMGLLALCQAINHLELSIHSMRSSIGYRGDKCQCAIAEREFCIYEAIFLNKGKQYNLCYSKSPNTNTVFIANSSF